MDAKRAAEAALFSSAEGLRISEISQRTGIPEEDIRTAVMDLRREYDERDSAIMISKVGSEYRMMLRTEYSDFTGKFAKAEMPAGVMRTLSTIAYNQPVLQSVQTHGDGFRVRQEVGTDPRAHDHQQVLGVLRNRIHPEVRHQGLDRVPGQELPARAGGMTSPEAGTGFPSSGLRTGFQVTARRGT